MTNRGRKLLPTYLHDALETTATSSNDPRIAADAGNALFLRLGFTLVWSGWDPDAPRANAGMTIRLPVARNSDGSQIVETIRDEIMLGGIRVAPPTDRLTVPLSYAAANLDQNWATLIVRQRAIDTSTLIPTTGWAYARRPSPAAARSRSAGVRPMWF